MDPIITNVIIFLASCLTMAIASKFLVDALSKIAIFLRIREFIVAFFLMAFGVSIPNLVVGVISAIANKPEISLGDVMGGNIFDFSIVLGLAVLFSNNGIEAHSRTVQTSSLATIGFAILPLAFMMDGQLSRIDGLIMIIGYLAYTSWLFSNKDRFTRPYEKNELKKCPNAKEIVSSFLVIIAGLGALILGGYGVVQSAVQFSAFLGLPLSIVGLFIVALGNCSPETFFCIQAARNGEEWMVLGDLMGGVAFCASVVLGTVAMISPISVQHIEFSILARVFLILVCLFFYFSVRTDRKITKKEGLVLVGFYVAFLISEIILGNIIY